MAVPAHDQRDFEFARKYDIPIRAVVDPGDAHSVEGAEEVRSGQRVFTGDGTAIHSGATRAADLIHAAAVEHGVDTILIGSHARKGLSRLLGSTANAVLHGSPVNVMTIRVS